MDAIKKGVFTKYEKEKADQWKTCAVGEYLGGKPHNTENFDRFYTTKSKEKMELLGYDFNNAVKYNEPTKAKSIYNQIHKIKLKGV